MSRRARDESRGAKDEVRHLWPTGQGSAIGKTPRHTEVLQYRTVPDAIKLQYNSKGTLYTVQYSTTYIYTVLGGKAVYRKNKTEDWFRSGFFISALTAAEPKLNTKLSKTVILTVNTRDESFASDFVKFGQKKVIYCGFSSGIFFSYRQCYQETTVCSKKERKKLLPPTVPFLL